MGLFWHFVALNPAQTSHRRELLDRYGQVAQISALIPLLAFPAYRALYNAVKRFKTDVDGPAQKERQSPQVSGFPTKFDNASGNWRGRVQWALDEDVAEGWGTRRQWGIAGLWTLWLLLLAMNETGDGMLGVFDLAFDCASFSSLPRVVKSISCSRYTSFVPTWVFEKVHDVSCLFSVKRPRNLLPSKDLHLTLTTTHIFQPSNKKNGPYELTTSQTTST